MKYIIEMHNGELHEYMSDSSIITSELQNEITKKLGDWKAICFEDEQCYRISKPIGISEEAKHRLLALGLHARDHLNRLIGDKTGPRITTRVLNEMFSLSRSKSRTEDELCDEIKQIVDMIKVAWPDQPVMKKELLLAMVYLFKSSPKLRIGCGNKAIENYLNYVGTGYVQAAYVNILINESHNLRMKNESKSLALAMARLIKETKYFRATGGDPLLINWQALK